MRNNPYHPPQKFYDFTRMSDDEIEAELFYIREEIDNIVYVDFRKD